MLRYKAGVKFNILEMTEKQFGSRQSWKVIMEGERLMRHSECTQLRLPPAPGVSFRGWVHPADLGTVDVATKLLTAASVDIVVATAGFTTSELGIVVGRTGRDLGAFSAMPEAEEITYPPGRIFRGHPLTTVDGLSLRVYEEWAIDDGGQPVSMGIDPSEVVAMVSAMIPKARGKELAVPREYCKRFTSPLE